MPRAMEIVTPLGDDVLMFHGMRAHEEMSRPFEYQLDLLSIKSRRTKNAAEAWKARAKVSDAGRRVVRSRTAASGPLRYRYDAKSGTVRKLPARVYKSLLAKSARVALGTAGGF